MSFLPWYGETPLLTKVRNSLAAACTASLELFMMKDCENNWGNSKYKHKQSVICRDTFTLLVTAWNQLYSCFGDFHYHCFGNFHIFSKLLHMNKLETTKTKYKCKKTPITQSIHPTTLAELPEIRHEEHYTDLCTVTALLKLPVNRSYLHMIKWTFTFSSGHERRKQWGFAVVLLELVAEEVLRPLVVGGAIALLMTILTKAVHVPTAPSFVTLFYALYNTWHSLSMAWNVKM